MRNGDYILVVAPLDYPGKRYRNRYAYEHHVVYWRHRGVIPAAGEVVHHINHDRYDNRIDNLQLLPRDAHSRSHQKSGRIATVECSLCGTEISKPARDLAYRKRVNKLGLFCSRSCGAKFQWRVRDGG